MNLPPGDIDLFYKLHGSLLAFANQQLKILPANTAPDQVRKQPIRQVAGLRNACYDNSAILDQYLAANPDRLSLDELAIVAGWRHRVTGEFYIVRYLKVYTVFMILEEPAHLYGVSGLIDPLEVVLDGAPLPTMVKATLLPFRDRIIYDGILNPYSIFFGPGDSFQRQRDLQPAQGTRRDHRGLDRPGRATAAPHLVGSQSAGQARARLATSGG